MQLKKFRGTADRLPEPFRPMLTGAASDFDRAVLNSELSRLTGAFREQVATSCQQLTPGRYPFVKGAASEIGLANRPAVRAERHTRQLLQAIARQICRHGEDALDASGRNIR